MRILFLIHNKFQKRIHCPNCFAKVELKHEKQKQLEVGMEDPQEEKAKVEEMVQGRKIVG